MEQTNTQDGFDKFLSIKLNDAVGSFMSISEDGNSETFKGLPYFSNIGVDHIQGYTQYGGGTNPPSYIFTHSSDLSKGAILIKKDFAAAGKGYKTSGSNHPSGVQTIGKYLFAAMSTGSGKSRVSVYDLSNIENNQITEVKTISFDDHKAACLGITDINIAGKNYYLLVVRSDENYIGYLSEVPDDMSKLSFKKIGSFTLENINKRTIVCEGFGLVTDIHNQAYMVALQTHNAKEDWGYLIKINASLSGITHVYEDKCKHFKKKGGVSGDFGTHFRWGAGIYIHPAEKLVVLATSRNIIAGTKLDANYWM